MIRIDITGINRTIKNINLKGIQIDNVTIDATEKIMQRIEQNANEILYRDCETWSHGWSTPPIEEMWEHSPVKYTHRFGCEAILKNVSEHSASQEFGVHHSIYPKNGKKLRLGDDTYLPYVAGHEGKYFLTKAINNDEEYLKIWIDYIKKVV